MRHFVNFSLLFFFVSLLATGLMRFIQPFSLSATRLHIVSGFAIAILVGFHIAARGRYFFLYLNQKSDKATPRSLKPLWAALVVWIAATAAAFKNWSPARELMAQSYESRHKAEIFRPEKRTAYRKNEKGGLLKREGPGNSNLLVEIEFGPAYDSQDSPAPQLALWAESTTRSLIETFYVSPQSAYSEKGAFDTTSLRRVDVLPLWRHSYTQKWGVEPDGDFDALTGATPTHEFSIDQNLDTGGKDFHLYLEINAKGDVNEHYHSDQPESADGHTPPGIGQPSLLYGVYIDPQAERSYHLMELVGHGGDSAVQNGKIHYDTRHFTTAKSLLEKVLVRVTPNSGSSDAALPETP